MHENYSRQHEVKQGSNRTLGLVFAAAFLLIGCWHALFGAGGVRWWAIAIAAAFTLVSWLRPGLLAPVNRVWVLLGLLLHRVVSPLVLGLLFYLVVTPTGLLVRLFGKDPLRLRLDRRAGSYWIERHPPGPRSDSMRNQF